jgi:hypothetical protein
MGRHEVLATKDYEEIRDAGDDDFIGSREWCDAVLEFKVGRGGPYECRVERCKEWVGGHEEKDFSR